MGENSTRRDKLMAIEIKLTEENNYAASLQFIGSINENVFFPELLNKNLKELTLYLNDFESINSVGILAWIRWHIAFKKNNLDLKLYIKNVRSRILSCASIVNGFFPAYCEVQSFYIPYSNEIDNEELTILIELEVDEIKGSVFRVPETIVRIKDGKEIQYHMSIIPEKDLRFLKDKIEIVS